MTFPDWQNAIHPDWVTLPQTGEKLWLVAGGTLLGWCFDSRLSSIPKLLTMDFGGF